MTGQKASDKREDGLNVECGRISTCVRVNSTSVQGAITIIYNRHQTYHYLCYVRAVFVVDR